MVKVLFAVLLVSLVFATALAQDDSEFEDQQADFSGSRIARSPTHGRHGGYQQTGFGGRGNAGYGNAGYGNPYGNAGLHGGNRHNSGYNGYNGGRPQAAYPGYNNNRYHG